jgi:hypothetical protein
LKIHQSFLTTQTGEASWEKPACLGVDETNESSIIQSEFAANTNIGGVDTGEVTDVVEEYTVDSQFVQMSEEEAAIIIQGLFRTRHAKKKVRLLLGSVLKRLYDEESGCYYYVNIKVCTFVIFSKLSASSLASHHGTNRFYLDQKNLTMTMLYFLQKSKKVLIQVLGVNLVLK